jgi:hypothetical protein
MACHLRQYCARAVYDKKPAAGQNDSVFEHKAASTGEIGEAVLCIARAKTQASGVVTRKERVTKGVRNAKTAPANPKRTDTRPAKTRNPMVNSTVPSPYENA